MKRLLGLLTALPLLAAPLTAQTSADSAGIRAAALDYAEGWYNADGDRMARALHPELAKRVQFSDSTGATWIRSMGATELIRGARSGGGKSTPVDKQRKDVKILDVFQKAASVRGSGVSSVSSLKPFVLMPCSGTDYPGARISRALVGARAWVRRLQRGHEQGGSMRRIVGVLVVAAQGPVPAIIGFMLIGVGVSVVVPLAFAAAGHAGTNPTMGVAGVATIAYGAGMAAPGMIGGIADLTSLRVAFCAVAVLAGMVALGGGLLGRNAPEGVHGVEGPRAAEAEALATEG